MLVARPIGEEGHRYYLAQIGRDGRGELPGRWVGKAAGHLDLAAEVDGHDLGQVLQGRRPDGDPLVSRRPRRVAGLDLIFAAPKSVSLAHGLGSDELAKQVRAAHDRAVDAAFEFLERGSAVVRQGPTERAPAGGVVGAAFRHRVSRADDPHLHTHVLLANMAPGPRGRWSALHTPLVFFDLRTVDALYRAALRHGITESLGWGWADKGAERGELLGIPRAMIEAFSRRQAQIVVAMEELRGRSRLAADLTRPARHGLIDHPALRAEWAARADGLAYTLPPPTPARPRDVLAGPPLPASDRFTRADVVRAWCAYLPDGAPVPLIEKLADRSLDAAVSVAPYATGPGAARLDGPHGPAPRYTTPEVLRLRQELADHALLELAVRTGPPSPQLREALGPRRPGVALLAASSSAAGAQRFERATGIVCGTLATVTDALSRRPFAKGPDILVDRAHRVDTIELAALAQRAAAAGGRLVLIAEPDQRRWSETFGLLAHRRGIAQVIETEPIRAKRLEPQVVAALGKAPTSLLDRCRWRDAATALTAYRERWKIMGDRALGGPPTTVEQRAERRQVERTMARAIGLSREGPGRTLIR